jgi:hypothetical protein
MFGRCTLAGWLALSAGDGACSRTPSLVTTSEGPSASAAPVEAPAAFARIAAAPPLPGSGPFYQPDPTGKSSLMLRFDAPNILYVGMDRDACEAELTRRGIGVEHAPETPDVVTPVWLRSPLHGVAVHSALSAKERQHSPAEIFDCRLVLAVDDFAGIVAAHDVVEIIHMSAHRARSENGCLPNALGLQHCAGLALDVGSFKKRDGTVLEVLRDFHGKIGWSTCAGIAKPKPPSPAATELWDFVCAAGARALFHVILTPNTNLEHKNHLHMEITPNAAWMLIH